MYKYHCKRLLDIFFSILIIVILSPILLVLSILVLCVNGYPILFKQKRPGLNAKVFTIYKFRTMNNKRDNNGSLLFDFQRLTKFGKFLRATSLDELPELINILNGDMSFVGPRPLLVEYLPLYNKKQKRRHEVRPGLTGLAQINGRNAISWEDKFNYDIEYIDNLAFMLDCKIILKTIIKIIVKDGINTNKHTTMESFRGSLDK